MHDERGDRVGGRRRIAKIAADARPALNLPAADNAGRVGQGGIGRGHRGVAVDSIASHRRAQSQTRIGIVAHLRELGNFLDVDNQVDLALSFAQLHQQIGAAGQHSGPVARGRQQADRLVDRGSQLVFEILHKMTPQGARLFEQLSICSYGEQTVKRASAGCRALIWCRLPAAAPAALRPKAAFLRT